ncbi:hypothetical protein [Pseudoflavonifractor phocaeensis]|uniref:hypothetical protein n=1 Tax=Pseudoflavonifractor phocaeensis TaxID=1870988 RepID=UPI00195BDB7F|nr:hypothetical protein [Pseudoflavonifractor phocaeensis]MBM6924806.1 hypothetical protein [Pseudoflavonifractor phocaeensis]
MSVFNGSHGITDGNILVWNQGRNPLVNFNFMLRVELLFDLPCKSVKAFTREMEYDFIQEGGLNDYVHMLRKPISRPFTLEVERYVGVDYVDPMPLGGNLALPVFLFVGRAPNQFIPGLVARTYVFTGCCVMKKTYGELSGDQSGLLVETTTLGYREMLCVDIPWSDVLTDVGAEYATPATNSVSNEARAKDEQLQLERLKQEAAELESTTGENASAASELRTQGDSLVTEITGLIDQLEQAEKAAQDAAGQTSESATTPAAPAVSGRAASFRSRLDTLKKTLETQGKDLDDNQATQLATVQSKNQEIQNATQLSPANTSHGAMKESAQKINDRKTQLDNAVTELRALQAEVDAIVNPKPETETSPAGPSAAEIAMEERRAKAEAAQKEREAEAAQREQDAKDAEAARKERQEKAEEAEKELEAQQKQQEQDAKDAEAARKERQEKTEEAEKELEAQKKQQEQDAKDAEAALQERREKAEQAVASQAQEESERTQEP